jgi:hypothetical protein
MKINIRMTIIILMSVVTYSCKKSNDNQTVTTPTPTTVTPTYYLKYKYNGAQITADSISVVRDTVSSPRRLIIVGALRTAPYYPKIQIITSETFIGWVDGLNGYYDYNTTPDDVVNTYDASGSFYSSAYTSSADQMHVFFSKLTYHKGDVITSTTFSGKVTNSSGTSSIPITEGVFNLVIAN